MKTLHISLSILALGLLAWNTSDLRAAETTTVKVEEKTVHYEEKRNGNWFTDFWVHRVGGTIGNGLKKGAKKIDHAFTGKDETVVETHTSSTVTTQPAPASPVAPRTETKVEVKKEETTTTTLPK